MTAEELEDEDRLRSARAGLRDALRSGEDAWIRQAEAEVGRAERSQEQGRNVPTPVAR